MAAYLDPISFQITGDTSMNLCLNKDLRGTFMLVFTQDDGTPINLTGLVGQLIITLAPCNGDMSGTTTLFSTGLGNLTMNSSGQIVFIVNDATVGLAGDGVYDYRFMLISDAATQQLFSGLFEINEN